MISRPQHKLTSGNTMLLYFLCWKFSTTYVFCIRILFTLHSILAPSRHSKTSTKNVDSRSAYDRSRLCFKADTGDNRDSLSERARVTSSLSDLVRYFLGSSRHAPRAEYHLTLRDIDLRAVYDTVTMKRPAFVFDGRVTLDGDARTGKISLKVTTIGRGDKEHNSHTPPLGFSPPQWVRYSINSDLVYIYFRLNASAIVYLSSVELEEIKAKQFKANFFSGWMRTFY